jgi:hypothetical protein
VVEAIEVAEVEAEAAEVAGDTVEAVKPRRKSLLLIQRTLANPTLMPSGEPLNPKNELKLGKHVRRPS